ncbi:glycoside hydrolase, partial [Actinocrinis puniceicyclus]|nr:glycoside hydrolase [Actinocrinis puniceicyclus]
MRTGAIDIRTHSSRLRALTAVAALAAAPLAAFLAASPAQAASTLRAAAEAQSRYMGTELTGNMVNNSTITNLAGTQFDMVT